jgi:hypothetical protein
MIPEDIELLSTHVANRTFGLILLPTAFKFPILLTSWSFLHLVAILTEAIEELVSELVFIPT